MDDLAEKIRAGRVASFVCGGGFVAVHAASVDAPEDVVRDWLNQVGGHVEIVPSPPPNGIGAGRIAAVDPGPTTTFYMVPRTAYGEG